MVSILLGVWCVEWRWCVVGVDLHCPVYVARALLIPLQCCWVLRRVMLLFFAGWCGVCGVCVCLWCSCGGVSCVCYPLVVVVGVAVVDGGCGIVVVGGMVNEGRVLLRCPSRLMLVSPFCSLSGRVEWRGVALCWGVPRLRFVPALFALSCFSSVLCCHVCCGVGVRWCVSSRCGIVFHYSLVLCLLSRYCWLVCVFVAGVCQRGMAVVF